MAKNTVLLDQAKALSARFLDLTEDEYRKLNERWKQDSADSHDVGQAAGTAWMVSRDLKLDRDVEVVIGLAVNDAEQGGAHAALYDALIGLATRGFISGKDYDALTTPWRTTVGAVHPDDAVLG
jgi:hypothetical protein